MKQIPTEPDILHAYNSPLADVLARIADERLRQKEGTASVPDAGDGDGELLISVAARIVGVLEREIVAARELEEETEETRG
jgi:hypothetical protein